MAGDSAQVEAGGEGEDVDRLSGVAGQGEPHVVGDGAAVGVEGDQFGLCGGQGLSVLSCVGLEVHVVAPQDAGCAEPVGANVKVVQQMLGHASAAMTLDIYAGLLLDGLDPVGCALDAWVSQTCRHGPVGALGSASTADQKWP
ncbi:hypothetical protein [Austwickia sp. TVS 96-490-7B]|uniref:hypothetical protein n=1 Tax=Austwickia sp. TVS 96-490-7B TaxID=2830843 RepID=UPI00351CF80E